MSDAATHKRVQTTCLIVLSVIAGAAALYWLRPVMIPFVLAVLLSYILAPLAHLMVRWTRAPYSLAIFASILVGFILLSMVGGLITASLKELAHNADAYEQKLTRMVNQGVDLLAEYDIDVGTQTIREQLTKIPVGSVLVRFSNAIVNMLSNTFLVLVFVIYLLQGKQGADPASGSLWAKIEGRIKRYLAIKVVVSAVTGTAVGLILSVLGVDLAMVFGVAAFVLNFIPSVGSVIATLLPLPVVLVSPDTSWLTAVLAMALPGTLQMVVGNGIEPKLLGRSLELHPITVLMTLILWGMLWGVVGMILATPMTAVIKILLDTSPITRPLADIMAGQTGKGAAAAADPAT